MKKFFVLSMLAALVAGGVFAADAKAATKTAEGVVVSYVAADTAKATAATLVVKVAAKDVKFILEAKTVVEGKDKKPAAVAVLKAGVKVEVKYTEDAKMVATASSVTLK